MASSDAELQFALEQFELFKKKWDSTADLAILDHYQRVAMRLEEEEESEYPCANVFLNYINYFNEQYNDAEDLDSSSLASPSPLATGSLPNERDIHDNEASTVSLTLEEFEQARELLKEFTQQWNSDHLVKLLQLIESNALELAKLLLSKALKKDITLPEIQDKLQCFTESSVGALVPVLSEENPNKRKTVVSAFKENRKRWKPESEVLDIEDLESSQN